VSAATPSRINLALQGGGAHGAFTWGVLERLLAEPWFEPEGISGTSSGAMNAVALAQGWLEGGRNGAIATLRRLWEAVAAQQRLLGPALAAPMAYPADALLRGVTTYLAPSQVNPLGINPLRVIAERLFDFAALRNGPIRVFVAATRVRDGALAVFGNATLDVDALLASTCLPQIFPPVRIDGTLYWDGGYAGNPVLEPLICECAAADILCVLVQPLAHDVDPVTARQIAERVAELGFSTTFLREIEALRRARRQLGRSPGTSAFDHRLQALRAHLIEPGEALAGLGAETRLDMRPRFLEELRELGNDCADAWLGRHRDAIGRRGTWPALGA
jgi:NTE family protein